MNNKTSALIFFDKLFAPLYFICSRLFSYTKQQQAETSRIFVIKLFGMGSIVRMVNVLKNAEELTAEVELVTLSNNRTICKEIGIKAHFIESKNPFCSLVDLIRIMNLIRKTERVKVIDLERKSNLSGIFRLLSANGNPCASFSFDYENRQQKNQTFITLKNKSILKALEEIFDCQLPSQDTIALPQRKKESYQLVVNINAGEYLPQRRYPIEHFFTVIEQLHKKEKSFEFIVTGLAHEMPYTKELTQRLTTSKIPFKDTTGKLSLTGLIELLKGARLLITNDSGPLHLAYYFNVPTVAIWGPTDSKLVGYPESNRMKNISLNASCAPCFIHPKSKVGAFCSNEINCLRNLDPSRIVAATMRMSESLNKFAKHAG